MYEHDFDQATATDWDRADARQRGVERPECPWVCTDRDVWHRNPFYQHPVGFPFPPHPEDDFGWEAYNFIGPVQDRAVLRESIEAVAQAAALEECPF